MQKTFNKTKPTLRMDIARRSVYRYFAAQGTDRDIWNYCRQNMSHANMVRLSMRILKERCENRLIECLIAEQDKDMQKFIVRKFKHELPDISIAMELHVHTMCLVKWKKRFLGDVSTILFFRLPRDMTFSLPMLKTLLHAIEVSLRYYRLYCMELVDPAAVGILEKQRNAYRSMYSHLLRIAASDTSDDIMDQIVKTKLAHRFASVAELARLSGYATGTVSGKINAFLRQHEISSPHRIGKKSGCP